MKGHYSPPRLLTYLSGIILLLSIQTAFADLSVLVIKSSDNRFFTATVTQLVEHSDARTKFVVKTLKSMQTDSARLDDVDLIVTLGFEAASYIATQAQHAPAIHSYLTRFQHARLAADNDQRHYSVLLEQPLARYLKFIQLLLAANHVGVLKPADDLIAAEEIQHLGKQLNLIINQQKFRKDDNPVNAVRKILEDNDVLLTLPAPEIYNRQSLKGILLASYRLNKPVVSYSPAHVKSGALAAIFISPESIGEQIAQLIEQIRANPTFKPRPFYYANDYDIAINDQVARSLNLRLADKQKLKQQLQPQEPPP